MRTKSQSGLNIFELIAFIAWVGIGCVVSSLLGSKFGWPGYVFGFLVGAGLGIGIFYGFIFCLAYLLSNIWPDNSSAPLCKNGKCEAGHYEIHKAKDQLGFNRFDWFCRCGERYHKSKNPLRFYEVLSDGSLKPYMKWKPFRGWRPDKNSK